MSNVWEAMKKTVEEGKAFEEQIAALRYRISVSQKAIGFDVHAGMDHFRLKGVKSESDARLADRISKVIIEESEEEILQLEKQLAGLLGKPASKVVSG